MNPRKKIIISLIAFGTLALILIILIIYFLFPEIKNNSEEILLQKKQLILLAKEKENLEKMEDIYKNYQSDLDKIEKLLIDPEVPIEFMSFLETTASTSDLQLEISSITKEVKIDPLPSLSLQTLVNGSFPNFLEFLEKLEASPYLIEILDLNTQRLTGGDTSTSLSLKVFTK